MDTTIVNFMLESGISLALFTLVYLLFLSKETYFVLNRIYLLGSVVFSFLLPFIHFQVNGEMPSVILDEITITALGTISVYSNNLVAAFEKSIQSIGLIMFIYWCGVLILSFIFIYRLLQISALILNNENERKNGVRMIKLDRDILPFSFFSFVFISKKNADCKGNEREILAHELEHVRQGHSYDVMIFELLTIFQWFNPFIWLLKRSIRENHEFLADHGVLKPEVSSATYRLLLLNSAFLQQPVIANNFNHSLIKNRIQMITRIKSSKTATLKLSMGIIVTAALLIIFAFDKDRNLKSNETASNKQVETVVADQQKPAQTSEPVFDMVDQMPVFPGGEKAQMVFIKKTLKYPDDQAKSGIQGTVIACFVVDKEGNVINPKIVRGVSPSLDREVLRVINIMPKWTPGKNKGKVVSVRYTVPFKFVLS